MSRGGHQAEAGVKMTSEEVHMHSELHRPEARAAFERLRDQFYLRVFRESGHPIYKRLGARLLILEITWAVNPEAEKKARAAIEGNDRGCGWYAGEKVSPPPGGWGRKGRPSRAMLDARIAELRARELEVSTHEETRPPRIAEALRDTRATNASRLERP
jgi:hypothetical protein